ncbi:MAG: WYL domain-containing protein [Propionibacteriaceae bacterium]|nr:WYL domain-containing protein [Propionibacteriaceae bacterium]
MRANRLLSLLWLLKSGRSWTAATLAKELEVSARTVLRDVEALSAAGVPVYCDRGRAGGVRLLPGFTTDVAALTSGEAQALLSAVAAAPLTALGLASDLSSALRKITAALPEQTLPSVRLADRILIDPGGWHGIPAPAGFDALQRAVLEGRRLAFRYQSRTADRPARRTVDPAGLVNAAGAWYVAAFHRGRLRFYHTWRISRVEPLREPARIPGEFDLAAAWAQARSVWHESHVPVSARVRLRLSAASRLHPSVQPITLPPGSPDRWVELDLGFKDMAQAVAVCASVGADLVVLAPAKLRDAIIERCRQVLELYNQPEAS